jgi:hypothetical protein
MKTLPVSTYYNDSLLFVNIHFRVIMETTVTGWLKGWEKDNKHNWVHARHTIDLQIPPSISTRSRITETHTIIFRIVHLKALPLS